MTRHDVTAALVDFDEVAKLQGLAPFATYHKALALASVGDFESAEALFAQAGPGGMQMTRRGVMARPSRALHRSARAPPESRGRPVAVADRGGVARRRSGRQSRRLAADQRR